MELLANSFYGYQIMHHSQHTVMKYFRDEQTHAAIKRYFFEKLDDVNNSFHEVELAKAQIEQKEPIIIGFIILSFFKAQN